MFSSVCFSRHPNVFAPLGSGLGAGPVHCAGPRKVLLSFSVTQQPDASTGVRRSFLKPATKILINTLRGFA